MGVSYFTSPNGAMQVYTSSGQALVTDNVAHAVSYTPAGSVNASTTFGAISVNGQDITSQITSGTIGALIDLRDKELPAAQSQLDQLADQLSSTLNAVHNQGTAVPAPATLTGSAAVTSSTPFSGTGTVRLAVTDSSGNLVSYQDLDLSGITTVGGLVSAINSGSSGLTALDRLQRPSRYHRTVGDGAAINEMSSSVGSSNQGFSDYFGLNDLVTGSGASDFSVRSDISAIRAVRERHAGFVGIAHHR